MLSFGEGGSGKGKGNGNNSSSNSAGGGGGAHKRVAEEQAVYVPLRHRLKFTAAEKAAMARGSLRGYDGDDSDSDRTPLMIAGNRGGYGATAAASAAGGHSSSSKAGSRRFQSRNSEENNCCNCVANFCCCGCCASDKEDDVLNSIFLAGRPLWYFRAVELQIMFTCMYMALWATNFVTVVREDENYSLAQECLGQFLM